MTTQRIETGTAEGDALGFYANLFSGWIELKTGGRLYLHYIISRCRDNGNTQALIRSWLDRGYDVRVVMPRPIMQHILEKLGFIPLHEYLPDQYEDTVEVWYRPASPVISRHRPHAFSPPPMATETFRAGPLVRGPKTVVTGT